MYSLAFDSPPNMDHFSLFRYDTPTENGVYFAVSHITVSLLLIGWGLCAVFDLLYVKYNKDKNASKILDNLCDSACYINLQCLPLIGGVLSSFACSFKYRFTFFTMRSFLVSS